MGFSKEQRKDLNSQNKIKGSYYRKVERTNVIITESNGLRTEKKNESAHSEMCCLLY